MITIEDIRNFINSFEGTNTTRSNATLLPEQLRPFDAKLASLWESYLVADENLINFIRSRQEPGKPKETT